MRVGIGKLGIIENTEIDLKPLTIFVGPNNAGKTWLAYALAGILGGYGWNEYARAYVVGKIPEKYPPLDEAIEKLLTDGNATIDLYKFVEDYGQTYCESIANFAGSWMHKFMSTRPAVFENMQISINLGNTQADFLRRIEKYEIDDERSIGGVLLIVSKKAGTRIASIYTDMEGKGKATDKLFAATTGIKRRLVQTLTAAIHRSLYTNVQVFPVERTAFITLQFGRRSRIPFAAIERIVQQLLQERTEQERAEIKNSILNREQHFRTAIGPVSYFLSMIGATFDMDLEGVEQRQKDANNNPNIEKYIDLSHILEKEILGGDINFSTPEPDPRRDILFQPTSQAELEIPIVSSMVKELSPLVLYLRYLAQPGELLIIDEPEMNLHPAAQVKITELLTMLVNAGLRVLVTTHSTYLVDHMTNLMEAAKCEKADQTSVAEKFFLRRSDAFISQEDASVYLFENGGAKSILDEEGRIDWATFSKVTDEIETISYEF
jgi:energy-coupling factor transporter ATP-binding protein EcfA2